MDLLTKAKCRHSKKTYLQRDFAADDYLSDTPPPPPLHTVYVHVRSYSHREERGGMGLTREKVKGATVHKAGSKIPT
jgi:hypothetical protein